MGVPSGGSTSRPLYNIEEKDDKVGIDSGPETLDPGLERFDSGPQTLDPGLERLAAGVKEDFSRQSSNNSGLDLAPSEQREELRFSPVIFASPKLGKKVQPG